jgi:hypothetical protein
MRIKPETKLGKWSVGLNLLFFIVISIVLILVKVVGVLSFKVGHWWDVTVLIFLANIAAFVVGLIAIIKNKENSLLVYLSVTFGFLVILFLFLHSLFISD